ncbi:MAG: DinB family protein [Terriglobales bacterium]
MADRCLAELFRGEGAHLDPVACLEDVPAALAGRKVDGYPHSIWQIVWHLNYWCDYDLRRIGGERPRYPEHAAESWPSIGAPASEEEWEKEVQRFTSLLDRLTALSKSGPQTMQRHVEPAHPSHETRSSSVEGVLWQTLVHNSYHIGQVAMLRRCFGGWPPPRGSDTW